jgi:DNA-binding response OmpR family regulator
MIFIRTRQPPPARISLRVPEPIAFPSLGGDSKKILIVDDDPVILKALSLALQSNGYQVVTATDAGEAIGQVNREKPDLLIVDVFLAVDPIGCGALGWDGFQLARWIKGSSCQAPIIIISGANEPEYRPQLTTIGARAFLTKPIESRTLLATVASLISEKRPVSSAGN